MEVQKCKECGNEIKTRGAKLFCSRSCSATYNNRGTRRHGKEPSACLCCGKKTKNSAAKYCNTDCFHQHRWETVDRPRVLEGRGAVNTIKRYLIETYNEECSECGQGTYWNDKQLVLQLDHIDGNSDNNHINNVRLLCPNCHTQTSTYGAKGQGVRYTKKDTKRNRYLQEYKGG